MENCSRSKCIGKDVYKRQVDGLYEKLGEYENLDELNYLASKLDELDDHDYNHFQAAKQISDYTCLLYTSRCV